MSPDLVDVVRLELALLDPSVRRRPDRVEELLDPEFREVGASGRLWSRAQTVSALAQEEPGEPGEAADLDARELAAGLVHSALDAVGLTAAVSTALTEDGISCNVVAGRAHDHLLVPVDRADDALTVLRGLSARR